jgi:hypothetical protein
VDAPRNRAFNELARVVGGAASLAVWSVTNGADPVPAVYRCSSILRCHASWASVLETRALQDSHTAAP